MADVVSHTTSFRRANNLFFKFHFYFSCQPIITGGYLPSSVYKTRTQYRSTTYPTIPALSLKQNSPQNGSSLCAGDVSSDPPKHENSTSNGVPRAPEKPKAFKSPILTPTTAPPPLGSTSDDMDLDVTLTGSCCETTLNNSTVSDSFSSDTLKSSNGMQGLKVTSSTPVTRPSVSNLPSPVKSKARGPDSKLNTSDLIYRPDRTFSQTPSKTTSYLSIYLNCGKPSSSRSDANLSQMNVTTSLDSLNKSNLMATLSNPATLSSRTHLGSKSPRPSLDGRGTSQTSLLIKMQKGDAKSQTSEDNFYDVASKRVIRYDAKDDVRSGASLGNVKSNLSLSPPTSLAEVLVSPKKPGSLNDYSPGLPKPEYMPHLKANGKQFFNYPPPEIISSKNNALGPSDEQQFSYLEKVQKLRLGGLVSPSGCRKVEASSSH